MRLGLAGASELARELGITQARVREHLRTLLRHGLVEVAFARAGGPGPRERVWRPTPKGRGSARPHGAPSLLVLFMRATRGRVGTETFVELLRETAHLLAGEYHPAEEIPLRKRITVLRGLLDDIAVASRLEEIPRLYRLHLLSPSPWEPWISPAETGIFYRTLAEDLLGIRVELMTPSAAHRALHTLQFHKGLN